MKVKTSELRNDILDWAVQQCEGTRKDIDFVWWHDHYSPSTDWAQGGPIIEREKITLEWTGENWCAYIRHDEEEEFGTTPLIAAMRCYVASKMGDEIEVPEELWEEA